MLSKSQAKGFFLTATAGFSGVFLWLTYDTIRQVPERSHEADMTPEVVLGKTLWEENNCMGCHTILGEGAYYAPELTKVADRRDPAWIRAFLKDPEAMFPGERKMVKYDFTDAEIDGLIAFFDWIAEIDTNGFPADPDLAPPKATPTLAAAEGEGPPRPAIFDQLCVSCHALGGAGGNVGPALDGVAGRFDEARLRAWLADPASVKPGTAMPNLHLAQPDVDALVAFLLAQH